MLQPTSDSYFTGDLGIGTTSPSSALHVTSTTANTNGMVRFQNNMDNNYETLRIESLGNYDAHIGFFADGDSNHYWGAGVDYTDGNFKIANDNLLATNTKFVVQSNGYLVAQSASNIRLVLGSTGNPDNNTSNWIRGNSGYLQYNCANLGHTWEITGSEKMRINSNGRVGIGETSPGAQLDVHSGTSSDIVKFQNNNGSFIFGKTANLGSLDMASDANFRIRHGSTVSATFTSSGDIGVGTTSPSAKVHSYASSTNAQAFHAQGLGSNNFKIVPYCSNGAFSSLTSEDDVCLVAENAGAIVLGHHASGYYGMRIQSTGSVNIGTKTEANGSTGGCTFSADSSNRRNFICATTGSGTLELIEFRNPNGTVGTIKTSGSSTSYATSSDYRLKENVNYTWDATTRLKQLKPARFNFKADADITLDGFLAHEVSSVVPQAISGEKDGEKMQEIDHSKLVPLLVKTIQELEARIKVLEDK